MPYYEPRPMRGPRFARPEPNTVGAIMLALALLALIVLAWLYGPAYCGVVAGKARQATVLVVGVGEEGSSNVATSSGFVIGSRGYVLTVADALPQGDSAQYQVIVGSGTRDAQRLNAWMVARGAAGPSTYAVLQVEPPEPLVALERADSSSLRIGDRVTAVGFPPDKPTEDATPAIEVAAGNVVTLTEDQIIADADVTTATPGGPLLNAQGQVVGLVLNADQGNCIALPSQALLEVWQQYTLPASEGPPAAAPEEPVAQ